MITQLKSSVPAIDFGFGITNITISSGNTITVWLNTPYSDTATITPAHIGATMVKVSDYEYQLTYTAPGIFEARVFAGYSKTVSSNPLTITVT